MSESEKQELKKIEYEIESLRKQYLEAFFPLLAEKNFGAHETVYSVANEMIKLHKIQLSKNIDLTLTELEKAIELNRIDFVSCLLYPIGELYTLTGVSHFKSRFDSIKKEFESKGNRAELKIKWDDLNHRKRALIAIS